MTLHSTAVKRFSLVTAREQRWQGEATTLDEAVHLAAESGFPLRQVILGGYDISGMDFKELELRGARLDRVIARGTSFREADLSGVDFSAADLRGANLMAATLHNASLIGADLRGADLHLADLDGASLDWAELSGAAVSAGQLRRTCVMALRTDLFTACIRRPGLDGRLRAALEDGTFDGNPEVWYAGRAAHQPDPGTVSAAELVPNEPRLPRLGERVITGRLRARWPRIGRVQAWLSGVRPGTPPTDPVPALTLEWLGEWAARGQGVGAGRPHPH